MNDAPQGEPDRLASEYADSLSRPSEEDALHYLEEVLRTADSSSSRKLPAGIRAILVTVKKYPQANVTDPIVAEELVAEILRDHWGSSAMVSDRAIELHQAVSQALLEDPIACQRLINLWNRVVSKIDGK